MSRMTDERLNTIDSPAMALNWDLYVEVIEALKAERAAITNELEACCAATIRAGLATGHADNVLMLVDHILEQHEETRTALEASEAEAKNLQALLDENSHIEDYIICDCCESLTLNPVDAGGHMQCLSCTKLATAEARVRELEHPNPLVEIRVSPTEVYDPNGLAWKDKARELEQANDQLRMDRFAILSVRTKEGLLASEWIARTGAAEQKAKAAESQLAKLREGLKRLDLSCESDWCGKSATKYDPGWCNNCHISHLLTQSLLDQAVKEKSDE